MILYRSYKLTPQDKAKIVNKVKELGWTLTTLAEMNNFTPQFLSQLLNGKRKIDIKRIVNLQTLLRIKLDLEGEDYDRN